MSHIVLRAQGVKKTFSSVQGDFEVLKGVDHSFDSGVTYAVSGASGTGKSTLLHILAGLIRPSEGTVFINEQNMALFNEAQREQFLNKRIGLLFQMPYLIKELTVLENVMTKGLIADQDIDSCKQEALSLLSQMGLIDKIDEKPPVLSGGQQQRVALARALFGKPSFLLADEPTGNLDPKTGKAIVDLLIKSQKEWGMGIIVSTHDAYVAQSMQHQFELVGGLLKKI